MNQNRSTTYSMEGSKGVFLLGVGAQKAGTSWLHRQLSAQPYADFGRKKEYHVLDALEKGRLRYEVFHLVNRLRGSVKVHPILRGRYESDYRRYFEYFECLLQREEVLLTGDITPAYCSLPLDTLKRVKREFNDRGITVKVVFLMRDPVERCWSAVRMHRKKPKKFRSQTENLDTLSEQEHLRSVFRTKGFEVRTNYHHTARRILEVFGREDTYLGLYERIFSRDELDRLSETLGLPIGEVDFAHRIAASPKTQAIERDLAQRIANHYREAYDFAREEFGSQLIDRAWPSALLIGA